MVSDTHICKLLQIVDFTLNLLAPFFKELLEGPITNLINTVLQHYGMFIIVLNTRIIFQY
jgi:hypothetical protein